MFNKTLITVLFDKMKPPCEEISKNVIPTTRALLVKDLIERHKLSQVDVATRLGITQPAVSQYLRALRGTSRTKSLIKMSDYMESLTKFSDDIAAGKVRGSQISEMYCKLCGIYREVK
jgi:predicted transcriptional regulator